MPKKKISLDDATKYLLFAVVGLSLLNTAMVVGIDGQLSKITDGQKELARPADVEVIRITSPLCPNCNKYVDALLAELKAKNINILEEKTISSNDATAIITGNNINKLPALVITGEVTKNKDVAELLKSTGGAMDNRTFVYEPIIPPYFDIRGNKVKGLVTATIITDTSCANCKDPAEIIDYFESMGVVMSKRIALDSTGDAAKSIVALYEIKSVPTVVFSPELAEYDTITKVWAQVGTVENDGTYVLRKAMPPYRNTTTNAIEGLVDIIYITDESCDTCYNATLHKNILSGNFGVVFSEEKTQDIGSAEGSAIAAKYNITKVPTVVLSKDASVYTSLASVWGDVGTVETDGSYVFREINALGSKYRDLETGEITDSS